MSAAVLTVADGALERDLRRRFRVAESAVQTAAGALDLLHPASAEELINEADFEQDERLPYWADIWPSSTVLAGVVARLDGSGRRALELGCGVGLVAAAAAQSGFAVTATDYYDDALSFTRLNVWRNAGVGVSTRHVDWRDFPTDLERFDLVLASDVLYERSYAELVAAAFGHTLAAGSQGLLADPGRVAASAFVEACAERGMQAAVSQRLPFSAGGVRQTIAIYTIERLR